MNKETKKGAKALVEINAPTGEQTAIVAKPKVWQAPTGPGLSADPVKQATEAGLPAGLVTLVGEAWKDCLFSPLSTSVSSLPLGRELWLNTLRIKLEDKVGAEKAGEVLDLVETVFPQGKDYENAVAFRTSFFSVFNEKSRNLLLHSCKAEDILIANGWGREAGEVSLSFEARKLLANLAAVYGNLKKFYTAQGGQWETVESSRESLKDKEEREEKPKAKATVDLSKLKGLAF